MQTIFCVFIVILHLTIGFYTRKSIQCGRNVAKFELLSSMVFGDIQVRDPIAESLRKLGITSPSPIQKASLVPLNSGVSGVLHAHTGSGKTMAYLLPIVKRIYDTTSEPFKSIIIVPTRELAIQVWMFDRSASLLIPCRWLRMLFPYAVTLQWFIFV